MKTTIAFCLFILVSCGSLHAQKISDAQKEAIMAKKVAFITNELQLTPLEAQTFWPVYNQYQAEIEAVKKLRKQELLTVNKDTLSSFSSAELQQLIDNEFVYEQQELDIKKKYYDGEFEKVLTNQKVVKLFRAEQLFKIYLLKEIQNKQ